MVSPSEISGVPQAPTSATETRPLGKTTAALAVQQAVYNLSKAIFDFSPESFALNQAISHWNEKQTPNGAEDVPEVFPLESRVGASLALLGYLKQSRTTGVSSVLATSSTAKLMEPVLAEHHSELNNYPVAFHIAAAEYDPVSAELISPVASVARVAKNLGIPLLSSSLALKNDAYNTSILTSVLASTQGPAFHVFDGVRGTHQAINAPEAATLVTSRDLNVIPGTANTIAGAFAATNKILGTEMRPFEYYGPAEPQTVYVTLGLPSVLARKNGSTDGVINVRLYSPFLLEEFLAVLPKTATKIVVVGTTNDLYKDVNANLRLYFGFKSGPQIISEIVDTSDVTISPVEPNQTNGAPEESTTGALVKVWDLDKSNSASAPARLAALVPEVSVYSKFDNFVAGGAIQSDVRFQFNNEFWDIYEADAGVVNDASILKSVDVTAGIKQGGKLVIASASDESLAKAVPAQIKLNAMAKQLEVFRVDYSVIDQQNTQGRTISMALQGLLWHLSGADIDTATSRVVHANSWDTELIAATVNKILVTLLEKSLVKLSSEALEEWKKVEISEKEQHAVYVKKAVPTSFVPVGTLLDAVEQEQGDEVDDVTPLDLKKRLVFKEAYNEHLALRPEVASKTFVAKVKRNHRVTPEDYDRNIFQLELDISGTGMKYAIGEALGVHAPNNANEVNKFLESYGVNSDEVFGVALSTPAGEDGSKMYKTAYQLGRDYLDLFGKAPKRFYEALSHFAKDEKEQKHLERLGGSEGAAELKVRTEENFESYVDVLHEFKSAHPTFGELAELIAPLKRREYSIASSQKVHPNEVHLLVVVVDWVTKNGEKRYGQCSKYLSDLPHGAELVVSVKPSVMKLPEDPKTPVIMAGLGTGLAPFKAFLEEKMYQRDNGEEIGPIYLFMGSRHQRQEYLYGELFEAYKAANVLTHIGAAFSRDQAEKIYIQHRIQQQKEALADAFVAKKGNFYLCGPTWPVPDISAALTEIAAEGAKRDGTTINEETLIEELKEAERYILEVY